MTCKDCVHCNVCTQDILSTDLHPYIDFSVRDDVEESCCDFKDKSKFIELPCSVGDYCIWHDDLWYANNITYCCDGSFILWMSMADKSPCGAEAVASEVEFISKEEAEKKLEAIKND